MDEFNRKVSVAKTRYSGVLVTIVHSVVIQNVVVEWMNKDSKWNVGTNLPFQHNTPLGLGLMWG